MSEFTLKHKELSPDKINELDGEDYQIFLDNESEIDEFIEEYEDRPSDHLKKRIEKLSKELHQFVVDKTKPPITQLEKQECEKLIEERGYQPKDLPDDIKNYLKAFNGQKGRYNKTPDSPRKEKLKESMENMSDKLIVMIEDFEASKSASNPSEKEESKPEPNKNVDPTPEESTKESKKPDHPEESSQSNQEVKEKEERQENTVDAPLEEETPSYDPKAYLTNGRSELTLGEIANNLNIIEGLLAQDKKRVSAKTLENNGFITKELRVRGQYIFDTMGNVRYVLRKSNFDVFYKILKE